MKDWLTPIGAMVVLLVANLGVTTWLSLQAVEQRRFTRDEVVAHRIRNEEVHKELQQFLVCIADYLPGTKEREACVIRAQAIAK